MIMMFPYSEYSYTNIQGKTKGVTARLAFGLPFAEPFVQSSVVASCTLFPFVEIRNARWGSQNLRASHLVATQSADPIYLALKYYIPRICPRSDIGKHLGLCMSSIFAEQMCEP